MMSEMKMITASELRADIKKGLHGVYLFCGPEEYMISAYTDIERDRRRRDGTDLFGAEHRLL